MAKDLLISLEGIGSSGKTTQGDMLAACFWKKYRIAFHKVVNRKLLQNTLEPLSQKESYKFWVANLHYVEIGTDLLAFTALMNERYHSIRSMLKSKPYLIILERYVDTVFAYTAARFALKHIADSYNLKSFAPEEVALAIQARADKTKVPFEELAEKSAETGFRAAIEEIELMHETFKCMKNIVRWPDLTIVLEVPVDRIKSREIKRENRAYTIGDVLLSGIINRIYLFMAKKEPARIRILDGEQDPSVLCDQITSIIKKKYALSDYAKSSR
jgi:thymidylate kinase